MPIEIRDDKNIKGTTLNERDERITSVSNKNNQKDNADDRLSMFADVSSIITTSIKHLSAARENIFTYEKDSALELHKGKTLIIKIGKARQKTINKSNNEDQLYDYAGGVIRKIFGGYNWKLSDRRRNLQQSSQGDRDLGKQMVKRTYWNTWQNHCSKYITIGKTVTQSKHQRSQQ